MHLYTHTHSNESLLWFQTRCLILSRLKALTKRVDAKISPDDNLKGSNLIGLKWVTTKKITRFRSESDLIDLSGYFGNGSRSWRPKLYFCMTFDAFGYCQKMAQSSVAMCLFADLFCIISQVSGHSPHVAFMTHTSIEPISSPDHASGGLQAGLGRHFG